MYSILAYNDMIADAVRRDAYIRAIQATIRPGGVVLDIGTGTGYFALLACQMGAGKVYAVETGDVIHLAKADAAANGYASKITFIQDRSTNIELQEQADLIIADLRGALPLHTANIPTLIDARKRLLAPGGTLIPRRDTLWAAVVHAPGQYERVSEPWSGNGWVLKFPATRQFSVNHWFKAGRLPVKLLSEPTCVAALDYRTIEQTNLSANLTWTVSTAGLAHGLSIWFDAELIEGVGFSNAPGQPELVYGSGFFPFAEPVPLEEGDRVATALRANLVDGDYVWRWDTHVISATTQTTKASFKQSSFQGIPLSPKSLRKRAIDYIPRLNQEGRIDQFILDQLDGATSIGEVAQRVAAHFPSRFPNLQAALSRVADLSQQHSE